MTRVASRHGPMTHEPRRRIAMATQAEVMKARLDTDAKIGPAAPMTTDAGTLAAAIEVVVMAQSAAHGAVLPVWEVQYKPLRARKQRLTQGDPRGSARERNERNEGSEHHGKHDPRVPSEHQAARRARAPAQQGEERDPRNHDVDHRGRPAMYVAIRGNDVNRQSNDQQAGRDHMCGLEIPVAWPEPRAHRGTRRHGEKEQREERQHAGVFVEGSRWLHVLDDPAVDADQ